MRSLTLALLVVLATAGAALAAAPPFLHVQGSLATSSGTPSSGPFDLTVSLWTAETAGVQLHWQPFPSAPVTGGVFDVVLGPLAPALFVDNAQVWLQVKVGSEAPLPRSRVLSVAFAIESARATVAAGAESLTCSGCVGSAQLDSDLALSGDLTVSGGVTACADGAAGCGFVLGDGAVVGRGGSALSLEADTGARIRTAGGGAWAPLHSGALTVTGAATITGNTTIGGTLTVGGLGCTGCIGTGHLAFDPATQAELSALQASLSPVATSGAYGDLDGAPDLAGYATLAGTNAFAGTVTVAGRLEVPKNAGAPFTCDSSVAGSVYLDSSDGHFYGCNGVAFVQLDATGGSGGRGSAPRSLRAPTARRSSRRAARWETVCTGSTRTARAAARRSRCSAT